MAETDGSEYTRDRDIYDRFREMLEAGREEVSLSLSVDPAEEGTESSSIQFVSLSGAYEADPDALTWADVAALPPFSPQLADIPVPGSILLMSPTVWDDMRRRQNPENVQDVQTLRIGGRTYNVLVSPHIPPGEIFAVRSSTFERDFAQMSRRVEAVQEQIDEWTESTGNLERLVRKFGELAEWLRPYLHEWESVGDYYDRQEIGYIREERQNWEPARGSPLYELVRGEVDRLGTTTFFLQLDFQDHRAYEPGLYLFRQSVDMTTRYWDVYRVYWEGPAFCQISNELLEEIATFPCDLKPGDDFILGGHLVRAIRSEPMSNTWFAKRIDGRWSSIIFWAEYLYVKLERRWHRVRYRR